MLNKIKAIFNKKFLAFNLFLILSVAVSAIISFAPSKAENKTNVNAEQVVETVAATKSDITEVDMFSLTYNPTSSNKVVKSSTESDGGKWTPEGNGNVDGGTIITLTIDEYGKSASVKWGTSTTFTYTPEEGYRIKKITVHPGSSDSNEAKITVLPNDTDQTEEFTPEDIVAPADYTPPSSNIFFKAHVELINYTLDGYYYPENETGDDYKKYEDENGIVAYKKDTNERQLTEPSDTDIPDFGYWMIRKAAIKSNKYNDYSITVNSDAKTITVKKDPNTKGDIDVDYQGVSLTFEYSGENANGYLLTKLKAKPYGKITQEASNPLIVAKLSRIYTLTISNNTEFSFDVGDAQPNLQGVFTSGEENKYEEGKLQLSATIDIKDKVDYRYPFTSNVGYAFYKASEVDGLTSDDSKTFKATAGGNYYCVVQYGYEISGWKIYYSYASGTSTDYYGFSHNSTSSKWALTSKYTSEVDVKENTNPIPIEKLNSEESSRDLLTAETLEDVSLLAEKMDIIFAGDKIKADQVKLYMEPVFTSPEIDVQDSANGNVSLYAPVKEGDSFIWGGAYSLETSRSTPQSGQTIAYYTVGENDDKKIVTSGCYNYIRFDSSDYVYSTETSKYVVTVNPAYVDDIFKVKLNGVNTLALNDYDYKASVPVSNVDGSGSNYSIYSYNAGWETDETADTTTYAANRYSYNTVAFGYKAYSDGLIEDYIDNEFNVYMNKYFLGIANGLLTNSNDRNIFKCVYNVAAVGVDSTNHTATTIKGTNSSYIYLAHNQLYNMPVFYKEGHELIAYINKYEYEGDGTAANPKQYYVYPTSEFNKNIHPSHFSATQTIKGETNAGERKWLYTDDQNCKEASHNPPTINAEFYRKYYILNIQTLLNDNLSNNGYVVVTTTDNSDYSPNRSGTYMVYYNKTDNKMEIYAYNSSYTSVKSKTLTAITDESVFRLDAQNNMQLKLYALCDFEITVKDQSKDASAALEDGDFVDFVGFRFVNIESDNDFISIDRETSYSQTREADWIEALAVNNGLASNDTINIDINFEQIEYELTMSLDNGEAGYFKLNEELDNWESVTISSDQLIIGTNEHKFKYFAYSGFTLATKAFTIGGPNELLQSYDDADPQQIYTLNFTSVWLRDNYYAKFNSSCDITDVAISTQINTGVLTFNFAVVLYDSTAVEVVVPISSNTIKYNETTYYIYGSKIYEDITHNTPVDFNYIIGVDEVTINPNNIIHVSGNKFMFSLNPSESYGANSTNGMFALLTNVENKGYVYKYDGKDYAVLSSELFYKSSQPNNTRTNHDFLKNSALEEISVDHNDIYEMTEISGTIIPQGERKLYVKLDVRKIMEINVSEITTDIEASKDPNGERYTTILNGTNNSVKFVDAGKIYTYMGAINTIYSKYDARYYTGVEYKLDGVNLKETSFKTSDDHELKIKYIVKSLKANVKYYVKGVETSDVSSYLKDVELYGANKEKLYIGDVLKYKATLINRDFTLSVTINDLTYLLDSDYTIAVSDYEVGAVNIVVELEELPASEVRVKLALTNNSQSVPGEEYFGSVTVYEAGVQKTSINTNDFEIVSIVASRSLEFGFTLKEGYAYAGKYYFEKTNTTKDVSLTDNKLLITNNFDENYGGIYYIYITKKEVVATLTVPALVQEGKINYTISSNQDSTVETSTEGTDKTLSLSLFVNAVIKFTADEANKEVLKYFYYVNKNGDTVYLTNDGTATGSPVLEYTLTSDILQTLEQDGGSYIIDFKAESTNKFKVEYSIIYGAENIRNNSFKVYVNYDASLPENVECENGGYYHSGTEINLFMETIETNKYLITILNRGDYSILNNEIFTLTDDLLLQIRIDPVQFGVDIAEGYYSNLTDLDNSTPLPETEHPVNNAVATGSNYKDPATLKLDYVSTAGDRVLYEITISKSVNYYVYDNKLYTNLNYSTEVDFAYTIDDDTVTIVGENYSITDGIIKVEQSATAKVVNNIVNIEGDSEVFSIYIDSIRNKVVISYTTTSVVNIQLNYADYKVISQFS